MGVRANFEKCITASQDSQWSDECKDRASFALRMVRRQQSKPESENLKQESQMVWQISYPLSSIRSDVKSREQHQMYTHDHKVSFEAGRFTLGKLQLDPVPWEELEELGTSDIGNFAREVCRSRQINNIRRSADCHRKSPHSIWRPITTRSAILDKFEQAYLDRCLSGAFVPRGSANSVWAGKSERKKQCAFSMQPSCVTPLK